MKSLVLFLLIFNFSCVQKKLNTPHNNAPNIYESLIIGQWKEYKTEWRDGSNLDGNGKVLNWNTIWEFRKGNMFISDIGQNTNYQIKGDTLFFSEQSQYLIEKLDSIQLTVIGISKFGDGSMDVRQYFNRVNK